MTLADLPEALLKTILRPIATLLLAGAGGDVEAAWAAAVETIRTYDPKTEAELRLAVRVVGFSIQAGEAIAQAANPQMPLMRVMRLRSGAVALSREAEKAETRLEKLRTARLKGQPVTPEPIPETESPRVQRATALIEDNRTVAAYAKAHGLTWSQALKQRQREQRLAERRAKEAARAEAMAVPLPA